MKSNKWLVCCFLLGFALVGCLAKTSISAIQPTQTAIIESNIIPSPTATSSLPTWCTDLKQENGLPASDKVRNSSIVYEAFAFDDNNHVINPVWEVSLGDGSEKLLLEKFPNTSMNNDDVIANGFKLYSSDNKHVAIWEYSFDPSKPNNTFPLIVRNIDNDQDVVVFQSDPGETIQGNWSPDGNHFIFTWYKNVPEYYSVVYSVMADGTELKELTGHLDLEILDRPYWSPDGKKIAVLVYSRGIIMIIDFETGHLNRFKVSPIVRVSPSSVINSKPERVMAWSSDSQWFAYISQYEHNGIEILNIENGKIYCVENEKIFAVEKLVWHYDKP